MELSERHIQKLENDGYATVYEVFDEPNTPHASRTSPTDTALIVTEGSMKVLIDIDLKTLFMGDRILIPASAPYSITAGPAGCKYVVGEK